MSDLETMARRLAEQYVRKGYKDGNAELDEAATRILDATTPPTMADVEWDDEKHFLAGAADADGHEVVMLGTFMGTIRVCDVDEVNEAFVPVLENLGNLTPNGKKYELREVGAPEEPEHPETLSTLEDYENAPEGTIVAQDGCDSWVKTNDNIWACGVVTYVNRDMVATGPYRVLRRGWGE